MNLQEIQERTTSTDYYHGVFLAVICALGGLLRIHTLGFDSFWLDETITMHFVLTMSYAELLTELPKVQPHLPLYYVLLKAWIALVGTEEQAVRLLSATVSLLTIPVLYAIGRRLYGFQVGAVAALLFAINPFQIYFAQEARMYALLAFLTVLSYYCLLTMLQSPSTTTTGGYILTAVLLAYTHVYGFFIIAAQLLYYTGLLVHKYTDVRSYLSRWSGVVLPITVASIPPIGVIAAKVFVPHSYGSGAQVRHIATPPAWHDVTTTFVRFIVRIPHPPWTTVVLLGLFVGVFGSLFVPRKVLSTYKSVLLWSWLIVPIGIAISASYLVQPIYSPKYLIGCSIALYLLFARGIMFIPRPNVRTALLGLILISTVAPVSYQYTHHQKREFEAAANFVDQRYSSQDLIVVDKRKITSPFGYYFDKKGMKTVGDIAGPLRPTIREQVRHTDTVWTIFSISKQSHRAKVLQFVRRTHNQTLVRHFAGITVYKFIEEKQKQIPDITNLYSINYTILDRKVNGAV